CPHVSARRHHAEIAGAPAGARTVGTKGRDVHPHRLWSMRGIDDPRSGNARGVDHDVGAGRLVTHREEGLIRALPALHSRLLTYAAHPLVRAGGSIATTAGAAVLPVPRVDVGTTAE